ncbi:alpha/beta hydrolase family protein [Phenylobacterium aquaticum]|uniref:alpha/beta hydrolase family protein n=1 Tax=Phenylobacterium aquaticum TaxID=1763816 RepID=UPI001F5DF026|nr:alpha/beta hydrolase [Phenylobacterium aquaticum]MCI3135246.1 alpha/beta fold hydrolase [Phenylobacterium aquaticum]
MRVPAILVAMAAAFISLPAWGATPCAVGAYRLPDGEVIDIGATDGADLRWRRFDGASGGLHQAADGHWTSLFGWTDRPDGKIVDLSRCAAGDILFDGRPGRRIAFDVTETTFSGKGVSLAGRLVLPKGKGRVPIVVLVHGAEFSSARDMYALQRLLPAEGVGVFVYDKRGTGQSGGKYSQDFQLLADDAAAAMGEARRLAGGRAGRVGCQGGSQGGWVVPLATLRAPADFAIVSFGLAVSVIDEDQQEIALEMKLKGHGPEEIAKALEVGQAAEAVAESGFTSGFAAFDAVRAKYRDQPWYKDVHGNFTHMLLPRNEAELRDLGKVLNWGTPWRYDPMPTLSAVRTPELWILGSDDLEAPSAETSQRIAGLIAAGRPFTLAMFPGAEHGMTEYEIDSRGERVSTRFAPGYFAMMRDFARTGTLAAAYGQAAITRAPASAPAVR